MSDILSSRLWRGLQTLIGRGRVTLTDDSGSVQFVQIAGNNGELRDVMPRLAEYGLVSNPPAGSDVIVVCIAGDRANGVVVASGNQQFRMRNLAPGETAIHDNLGQSIYLSASGIRVQGAGLPITIDSTASVTVTAPQVTVAAATSVILDTPLVKITGDLVDQSGSNSVTLAELRSAFRGHGHAVEGVQSGTDTIISDGPSPTV